jgi:hydrogenase nickel incorporation protein HypA/HybF
MEETPVVLRCRSCGREFTPEVPSAAFAPCPGCGEELGHTVLSGRELYIDYLELE